MLRYTLNKVRNERLFTVLTFVTRHERDLGKKGYTTLGVHSKDVEVM